jgi:thermitase
MLKCYRRALCSLAVTAAAAAPLAAASQAAYANVQISFPAQAMEGNLQVSPGDMLEAGYSFNMPGSHPAAAVEFPSAQVTFNASCVSGSGGGVITVPLGEGPYTDPAKDAADWFPSGDPASTVSYEGSVTVPNLCGGRPLSLAQGGTFTATLESSDPTDPVRVRWHYSADGSKGAWSSIASFTPGTGGPPPPPPAPQPTQIIVKVDTAGGYTIGGITSAFPVAVDPGGLASRGIYLVSPTSPDQSSPAQLQTLATQISTVPGVVYAEVNLPVQLADTEFHGWPYGTPVPDGTQPNVYTHQVAATELQLAAAQRQSQGTGVTVAVLDTGAAPVPALSSQLLSGWNYVADDADTSDVATAAGTQAVGHGTFVCGLVALVAPQARILPEKVLDSNGFGTIYGAAQAVLDATAAGANVINLSFGTETTPPSNLLQQAIQQAQAAGVVVVAAAGNEGTSQLDYPAAWPQTLSVAALDSSGSALASFSNFGQWVNVAAPGVSIVGPLPDGSYGVWAGTSMSAPFVAGQAALILSLVPGIDAGHVFQAIDNTASMLGQNPIHFGIVNVVSSLAYAQAHP